MTELPVQDRSQNAVADVRRERAFGAALAELALTVSLIVSIAVILAVAGTSGVDAATRSDLIMMEESVGSSFTTVLIVAVIGVVMAVLTILALRDVAPSKRGHRRHTTTASRR
jgi:ABC-type Fe3+ transport system permease subunit